MAKANKKAPKTSKTEKKPETQSYRNIYQSVTDRILADLEKGTAPWVKPWKSFGSGNIPRNVVSKRPYSGGNVVMLWAAREAAGYPTHNWLTFKQALELGGNVKKGEKGTQIFYLSRGTKKDEETGQEKSYSFAKGYTVFNVAQCENLPESLFEAPKPVNTDERDELADEFFVATGAEYVEGGEAYYLPSQDRIVMPAFEAFRSKDHFYATKLHETGHWTGAKHRLDRNLTNKFGSVDYAREELVAELTSAFLCAEFGFDGDLRHAGYIDHWIKLLKEDDRAFINAASLAQKAADYLRGLALKEAPATDEDEAALAA